MQPPFPNEQFRAGKKINGRVIQMKKIDYSQIITILANIGMIGGILLLAYERRQNNELMVASRFCRHTTTKTDTGPARRPDIQRHTESLENAHFERD